MIVTASRLIRDNDSVFIGQGLPVVAALLAKKYHAKNSVIMHEYGVVDTNPPFALELAHPIFAEHALYFSDMIDALGSMIYRTDIALLGAAQIDRYCNINTTSIGDYRRPKMRISGSGGANDIGSLAPRLILLMDGQSQEKFPEKVDYVTTPGFLHGRKGERAKYSLPGQGPELVVTDLGMYAFAESSGEMQLAALQHGVELKEVQERTAWKISSARKVAKLSPPTDDELRILRKLDPQKIYLH